jgi:hypothetical protein
MMPLGLHTRAALDPTLDERLDRMMADLEAEEADIRPRNDRRLAMLVGMAVIGLYYVVMA